MKQELRTLWGKHLLHRLVQCTSNTLAGVVELFVFVDILNPFEGVNSDSSCRAAYRIRIGNINDGFGEEKTCCPGACHQ